MCLHGCVGGVCVCVCVCVLKKLFLQCFAFSNTYSRDLTLTGLRLMWSVMCFTVSYARLMGFVLCFSFTCTRSFWLISFIMLLLQG